MKANKYKHGIVHPLTLGQIFATFLTIASFVASFHIDFKVSSQPINLVSKLL
jgi:hypothetical protein